MKLTITNTCSIYHHKRTGNKEEWDSTPAYTKVNTCISPTGTDIQVDLDQIGSFQLFEGFFYDITLVLQIGDKIVTESGDEYSIHGAPNKFNNHWLHYIRAVIKQII